MCTVCHGFSRRRFCTAALAMPLWQGGRGLVEPALRMPPSSGRRVAVTLDACPGHFDTRIATAVVAHNIKVTVFVTAIWMRMNPQALAFLLAHPGVFNLQNHGARHLPPVLDGEPVYGLPVAATLPAIQAEVLDGAAAIVAAGAPRPSWYRAAAAVYSPQAVPFIEGLGFGIGGYALSADKGASLPAGEVAARIAKARDGDVIIGHINQPRRSAGAGIAAGLVALQAAGAEFSWLT
jgi:peptidoglycan/xylan/chitin deacetylase (PgdA/CDA1 family)